MDSSLKLSLIGMEATCRRLIEQTVLMRAELRDHPDIALGGRLVHCGAMLSFFAAKFLELAAEVEASQPAERTVMPTQERPTIPNGRRRPAPSRPGGGAALLPENSL